MYDIFIVNACFRWHTLNNGGNETIESNDRFP